eukprot:scaffold32329_cov30-Tisochrysis_lutea.AAC.3
MEWDERGIELVERKMLEVAPMMVEVMNSLEAQWAIASCDGVTLSRCLRATATYAETACGPSVSRNDFS